jgi:hypothetical protein
MVTRVAQEKQVHRKKERTSTSIALEVAASEADLIQMFPKKET